MPIYEYSCLDCSKTFEKIVWNSGDKEVQCPYCQSKNNFRVLSAFSKGSGGFKGHSCTFQLWSFQRRVFLSPLIRNRGFLRKNNYEDCYLDCCDFCGLVCLKPVDIA